jgi:hypothetical protein
LNATGISTGERDECEKDEGRSKKRNDELKEEYVGRGEGQERNEEKGEGG